MALFGHGAMSDLSPLSGVKRKSNFGAAKSVDDPGCVKTRLSQRRAELFSQLPSPNRSCQCNWFSTTTKSSRKFYAQVQRRSFHTAWTLSGPPSAWTFAQKSLGSG